MSVVDMMFSYIKFVLTDAALPAALASVTPDDALSLYKLSSVHDMAPIVSEALERCGALNSLADSDLAEKFRRAKLHAIYRHELQDYELTRISALFEREQIEYLPLKGLFMKPLYPEPWMRTCHDLDILVSPDDISRAIEALTGSLSYVQKQYTSHDVILVSPSGVILELHHSVLESTRTTPAAKVLSRIRESASRRAGSFEQTLDMPMYIFFHFAHMVDHFVRGGCGIRPFIDLYILRRIMPDEFFSEKAASLLREGELEHFADASLDLINVWFDCAPSTEETRMFAEYIISGGVYGSIGNKVAVTEAEKSGFFHYVKKRLFFPFERLEHAYPSLHRRPWLFPFYQVRRWVDAVRQHGIRRYAAELKLTGHLSREMTDQSKEQMSRLRSYLGI